MWDAEGTRRAQDACDIVDSTGGLVEFNFILEMSFLISEDLLNCTCNYCSVAFIKVCFWQ